MQRREIKAQVRYAEPEDCGFWFSLDGHLTESEFTKKVKDGRAFVACADGVPVGILRYNMFWDEIPFCTMLYIEQSRRNEGHGAALMRYWENEMRTLGYGLALTSTRADEQARHFYRKLGYKDCGSLVLPNEPTELLLMKNLE